MAEQYDRRSFIARGMKTAVGAAALGGGGSALLGACSSSSGPSSSGSGKSAIPASPNVGISSLPPKRGGKLVVGTYSEASGIAPAAATSEFDATTYTYAQAIFDPLAVLGMDGTIKPYLAESISPNESYDVWSIRLRPGLTFHDGTPCDSSALVANFTALRNSLLTGQALKPIRDFTAIDPLTVAVAMTQPWVAFPAYLTGQGGFVMSPKYIGPNGEISDQASVNPVGTGPFVFQNWQKNISFNATRNPHYWRNGLPYLDAIEFRPLPDDQSREATLRSGGINIMHSQDPASYVDLAGDPSFQVYNDAHGIVGEPSIDNLIMNCQTGPTSDPRVRQALTYASNRNAIRADFFDNIPQLANGLFMPGETWYEPVDFPQYNPAKARELIASYQQDHPGPIEISLSGPSVTRYVQLMDAFRSLWEAVGFKVTITSKLQSSYTLDLVTGNFGVGLFQFFSAADPDQNYIFLISTNVGRPGAISLNLARNSDPTLDTYLNTGRTNPDPQARIEAYKNMNARLVADLAYLTGWQTLWVEAADTRTMNFRGLTAPDGSRAYGFNAGQMWFTTTWLNT